MANHFALNQEDDILGDVGGKWPGPRTAREAAPAAPVLLARTRARCVSSSTATKPANVMVRPPEPPYEPAAAMQKPSRQMIPMLRADLCCASSRC